MKKTLITLCIIASVGLVSNGYAQEMMMKGNPKTKVCHMEGCKHFNAKGCTVSFDNNEAAIMAGYRKCRMCEKKMKQMMMDNPMINKKMDPNSLSSNMMMSKKMETMSNQMMIDDAIMEEPMMKPMMMMKNMESMMHTMQLIMDQMMPMEDTSSMM